MLPRSLQALTNKCANSIRNLAVNVFNTFDDQNLSLDLMAHAMEFETDRFAKKQLSSDYDQIGKICSERNEQKVNEPVLKKYASTLIELRSKITCIDNKSLLPNEVVDWVNSNISIDDINDLGTIFDEIRNSLAHTLRNLSIACWNSFNDVKCSLELIEISLTINSDTEV